MIIALKLSGFWSRHWQWECGLVCHQQSRGALWCEQIERWCHHYRQFHEAKWLQLRVRSSCLWQLWSPTQSFNKCHFDSKSCEFFVWVGCLLLLLLLVQGASSVNLWTWKRNHWCKARYFGRV